MSGTNCIVYACGAYHVGKTYTMLGLASNWKELSERNAGLIIRSARGIFSTIEESLEDLEFTIRLSVKQITKKNGGEVSDLFSSGSGEHMNNHHHHHQDGIYLTSCDELQKILEQARKLSHDGNTVIYTLRVTQSQNGSTTTASSICFVDLNHVRELFFVVFFVFSLFLFLICVFFFILFFFH